MARSRNFGRSRCERRKVISQKELKSKHRLKQNERRVSVHTLSLRDTYELINAGEVEKKELNSSWQLDLYKRFRTVLKTEDKRKRLCFRDALFTAEAQGLNIQNHSAITIICNMAMHAEEMIRPMNRWKVEQEGYRGNDLLQDFISHCFALYEVPKFLNNSWMNRSMKTHREWYLKVAQGTSLRELEGTPIPVSKKLAHMLRSAPSNFGVDSAFRWSQAKTMGASDELTTSFLRSRLGYNKFRNDDYWKEVMRWMIAVKIDPNEVDQIIDYLSHEFNENGPMSMKGRTLNSVSRLSDAWHLEVQTRIYTRGIPIDLEWDRYKTDDLILKSESWTGREYSFVELASSAALRQESASMHHCVYTYAYRCQRAECVIFSLRCTVDGKALKTPLATIEMIPSRRTIVQVRAVQNRTPEQEATEMIKLWAKQMNLKWDA